MHLFKTTAAVLLFGAAALAPAMAQDTMSAEQCQALLAKADKNGDGSLGPDEMQPFADKMAGTGVKTKNATVITKEEFMDSCQKGTFKDVMMQ